ncbi:hypothetical protein [Belnapia moabensis]|uniref:hypothetical protein n=1 Tax=Belnapia moabensis TaxID=365533 RepID=UPI0005BD847A|nr:hypothetical protein [Belnapia moabensis]
MATILPFPAQVLGGTAQPSRSSLARYKQPITPSDWDKGLEADDSGRPSLGRVAGLAATSSQTLADMTEKAEVLLARLADDEAGAGLCQAEVQLLTSLLQDLRAFALISPAGSRSPVHEETDAAAR